MFFAQSILQNHLRNFNLRTPHNFNAGLQLKQPLRLRGQECHKFAHLTMKNCSFARFARAFFVL